MKRQNHSRAGFTMVELLVVMGIVLVLAVLGIGAVFKSYSWVQTMSTENTMQKVQERLARRYDQIVREARDWDNNPNIMRLAAGNPKRAEALKVKLLYKWSLPMNYAEVIAHLYESGAMQAGGGPAGYNYSPTGYPPAVALAARLRSRLPPGTIPNLPTATSPAPPIATALTNLNLARAAYRSATGLSPADDLRNQNSAVMLALFEMTFGASVDDLEPSAIGAGPPGNAAAYDNNNLILDAWGTPLFYLRYGNLITNAQNYAWLANVLGPAGLGVFPPTSATFGGVAYNFDYPFYGNYYSPIVDRAKVAFPTRFMRGTQQALDPDDPESTLALGWRTQPLSPYWVIFPAPLPLPTTNGDRLNSGFTQLFGYFMTTFGTGGGDPTGFPRMFAPLVVLSAGPDRQFTAFDASNPNKGWDDNLDGYRLSARLGGRQ